jgi:hypothetical protein
LQGVLYLLGEQVRLPPSDHEMPHTGRRQSCPLGLAEQGRPRL